MDILKTAIIEISEEPYLRQVGIEMNWEERKRFYDEHYFTEYSGYVTSEGLPSVSTEVAVERAKILYDLFKPTSVLDCGCATGWLLHGFRNLDKGIQVAGFDISQFVVDHTYPGLHGQLSVIDISDGLFYDDEAFDLVVIFDLLEHLQDYDAIFYAAQEICRVSNQWIFMRLPMVKFVGFDTEEQIVNWLASLNSLSHKTRLTLVDIAKELLPARPENDGSGEHPNEHPREFWVELFTSLGYEEYQLPEGIYRMPNVLYLHSYSAIAFRRICNDM